MHFILGVHRLSSGIAWLTFYLDRQAGGASGRVLYKGSLRRGSVGSGVGAVEYGFSGYCSRVYLLRDDHTRVLRQEYRDRIVATTSRNKSAVLPQEPLHLQNDATSLLPHKTRRHRVVATNGVATKGVGGVALIASGAS